MNGHHLRFVCGSQIEHHDLANLRLHVWSSVISWLALVTILSQVPFLVTIPVLGANLGAAYVVLSLVYWLPADLVTVAAVGALTVAWSALPWTPWGPGHGLVAGVAIPLVVFGAMLATRNYAHVYHHERASFMNGEPRGRVVLLNLHALLWGPFHYGLLALLRAGHRPALKTQIDESERLALRARGSMPWVNWAGTAACHPQYVSVPQTIDDLAEAVASATGRGQRVRVVASGFSWTSIGATDETLIFCERLDGIAIDTSEPQRPTVWVEAGVTNRQLNRELERVGLCMPFNVVLETVRVAGLVTVGTHGTGRETAVIGDLVEAMEVIDAAGKLRVLSNETVDAETMKAARVGLGLFGVIARVKLRVVPMYRVRQSDQRLPATDVLARLPDLVRSHDSVELYWFPFNTDVWMRTIDRTDAPRTYSGHGFWFTTQNFFQNAWLSALSWLVIRFAPSLTKALLRTGMYMLPYRTRVMNLPESHHYHHWIEMMPCGCMEVGFKADPDLANVRAAWEATERLVADYAKRGLYPLNLTLNVRFIGSSDGLLTPANGEGLTCYVEVMWRGHPEGWKELTSELCREWLKVPGALPHWSKQFEHVEGIVPIVRKSLGDRRDRFLAALAATGIDPDGRFWNPLTRRILTDEAEASRS